ncbi:MAG: 3'-5' exonuclease [Thermodesulfovibrionales bacterium]|nr:3'-5' exonuclease [Thermodesulfovibrionales bacterium]
MVITTMRFRKKEPVPLYDNEDSITNQNYVVIDTELTGLDETKDSLVSIGAVKMKGRRIELGCTFHRLIKPSSALKSESILIHRITPNEVEKEPSVEKIIREFINFCGNDIIIGHFVSIDMSFINKEVRKITGSVMRNQILDTSMIYQYLKKKYSQRDLFISYPGEIELYELAKRFCIPISDAHDALADAFLTAQLFQRFIPLLIGIGIKRIGDLLSFGSPYNKEIRYRVSGEIVNF